MCFLYLGLSFCVFWFTWPESYNKQYPFQPIHSVCDCPQSRFLFNIHSQHTKTTDRKYSYVFQRWTIATKANKVLFCDGWLWGFRDPSIFFLKLFSSEGWGSPEESSCNETWSVACCSMAHQTHSSLWCVLIFSSWAETQKERENQNEYVTRLECCHIVITIKMTFMHDRLKK